MTTYLLRCEVDPARSAEMPQLRAAHLAHIGTRADDIVFGGVVGADDGPPVEIVIVLSASSADDVASWVATDPYAPLYLRTSTSEFHLRLPFAT